MVLGALPRLFRRPRVSTALILAAGLAILANSRPFEGLLLAIPVAVAMAVWMAGKRRLSKAPLAMRVVAPVAVVLLLVAMAMGYYNWRVFGNPLTLPYQINRATYAVSPVFIWQSPRPEPVYRYQAMRDFYLKVELPVFQQAQTWPGFLFKIASKTGLLLAFFLGPLLAVPLVMFRRTCRDRRTRFLVLAGVFFMLGFLANAFKHAHYLAPITALVFCVIVQSMRHLRLWRPGGQPAGIFLVRAMVLSACVMGVLQALWAICTPAGDLPRTAVLRALSAIPGRHLVIVSYGPRHDSEKEWVFNAADIDRAPIVWARDMGPGGNQDLLCYFRDRKIWAVNGDSRHPQLSPYVSGNADGLLAGCCPGSDGRVSAVSRRP